MILLEKILQLKGPAGADIFLSSSFGKSYLKRTNPKKIRDFLELYLSYFFNSSLKDPFKILDYADLLIIVNDSMLANSKYFKSMSSEHLRLLIKEKKYFFKNNELPLFCSLLLEKVTTIEELLFFLDLKYSIPNLPKKILAFNNISLIISNNGKLSKNDYLYLINNIGNTYTISDLKRFAISNIYLTPDLLLKIFKKELNIEGLKAIYEIVKYKSVTNTDYFRNFVIEFAKSSLIQKENLEYFAKRVLESNNIEFMKEWVINTSCMCNCKIIDVLINRINNIEELSNLVISLNKEYINPTLSKIKESKGEEFYRSLINKICESSCEFFAELINIVDLRLLTKENTMKLVEKGYIKTGNVFNEIDLSESERLRLLKNLVINNIEVVALFGPYLLTGNKSMLLGTKETSASLNILEEMHPKM